MFSVSGRGAMRRWPRILGWLIAAIAAMLLALAAFPWGFVASHATGPLSKLAGRSISVGSARRIGALSLNPTVDLTDVRIAQAHWAGPGDLATVHNLVVRFEALPLLVGEFRPMSVAADGVVINLHRFADGRENWNDPDAKRHGVIVPALRSLTVSDGKLVLRNDRRKVLFAATITVDGVKGLRIEGSGIHRGQPLKIIAHGLPIDSKTFGGRYPVEASLRSPLLNFDAAAQLDRPIDLDHYDAQIHAAGHNLTYLDDIIQAGLFDTQPFNLTASLRHDSPTWIIRSLTGSIGRSRLSAKGTTTVIHGRSRLDLTIDADRLDFDDLSSDAQLAAAKARLARIGVRILPNTPIILDHFSKLDGTLRLKARRLLVPPGSPFRALDATVSLDHRLLRVMPVNISLLHGSMNGSLVIDHEQSTPKLTIDLRIKGARTEDLLTPDKSITAPLGGRILLAGHGDRIDDAIGRSGGHIALVAQGGTVRKDVAFYASGDAVKTVAAAIGHPTGRVPMTCLVGDFAVADGAVTPALLAIGTPRSRIDGKGSIHLANETMALSFTSRAIQPGLLQSTTPLRVDGSLARPQIGMLTTANAPKGKPTLFGKVGSFLKGLRTRGDPGRSIPAARLNCTSLAARLLSSHR